MNIIENIENYINSVAGDKSLEDLANLSEKLKIIKNIIEASYTIGDYVDKFESYKEQLASQNMLQNITSMMIPEFKEFISKKFEQLKESQKEDNSEPKKQ